MKKIFTLALFSIITLAANATDLFSGNKHVSWDEGGIQIEAAKFVDAKAGDKIVVSYTGAADGIEFKVMDDDFHRLPGTLAWKGIDGDGSFEQFLTPAAANQIKQNGLEIIGGNFTCTKIELQDGKGNVEDNTVWTGYFWMDEWSTLEIVKSSFDGINWSDFKAIRFYSEANRTDYAINIKVNWEPDGHIADAGSMTMTNEYAELNLEGVDMPAFLAKDDRLMIQCNKEGGAPFNFTSVVLVKKETDGIKDITIKNKSTKVYDLQGRSASMNTKGLLISNGRKFVNK